MECSENFRRAMHRPCISIPRWSGLLSSREQSSSSMRVPIRKRLAPVRTQKSLQIPIMRCSAVASLLAYFFSPRQARSRFYRALLAGISNALHSRIAALLRERYWRNQCQNKGRSLLSTVRNVFLKTDRSCRRIDHRCCCGESVSIISFDSSLPRATTKEQIVTDPKYAAFTALDPFFDIVQQGLAGLVDGDHYFDTIADDAEFEFRYHFPGWPQTVRGRDALMALYVGYGNNIVLHGADELVVHRSQDPRVVIIEYDVHGKIVATGSSYDNRFISVVTIEGRKIVQWRDYMDSLAAMTALSQVQ